ncbi:uncharacterized protein LOC9662110 [Selaginella moellendorffii]|uniref:uncharacterized protein LOC9662110 n=1 Tax=Selaginella moellendorffii TaxID=88036 RepID=UPI000D1CD52D|nr:uncharacterized protein LOC9662110 [Selaginella moellendorffii]|eukprot:XP_024543690.1 uncharacterized protein LOC9662110 [Selaginella moellendorffii]
MGSNKSLILLLALSLAVSALAVDSYDVPHKVVDEVKVPKVPEVPKVPYKAPEEPKYGHDYGYPQHYEVDTTVIQGYIYCQGCYGQWTKHIVGGEVAVECKNEKGAVVKGSDSTDKDGFYQVKLPYVVKTKTCTAKLVKSSDYTCDVITNVGKGKEGAGVAYLKTFKNEVFYKVAPFAFSQVCHPHY